MAPAPGPSGDDPRPDTRRGTKRAIAESGALALFRMGDALVDPRILLAWLLSFVGAPALVGLLVPVREGGAFLARHIAARALRRPRSRKPARIAAASLAGLAAFGISGAGLLLWGAIAGWTLLGLLLVVAIAAGTLATAGPGAAASRPRPLPLPDAIGAAALLALALLLAFELGPRGALVIWALMAAGGAFLLAALLFAAAPAPEPAAGLAGGTAVRRARNPARRIVFVPAALAPPFMVALVSTNPGTGLAALGGLLLAAALAALLGGPLVALAGRALRRPLALVAGIAAAALALAALADLLGWLDAPGLLPVLIFVVLVAARPADPARTQGGATGLGLALLAGALLAPLTAAIGTRATLLVLAALLAAAVPVLLQDEAGPAPPAADGA